VRASRASTLRFDLLMIVVLGAMIGGFFADLWAHSHGRVETFFTIWHLALYSAAGLVFLVLAVTWARALRAGAPIRAALPEGYGLSLAGALVFMIGGFLDLLWHLAFGIEVSISALFSPTHLILFGAGLLMVSGPLRAAWQRGDDAGTPWVRRLPMVLSIALVLAVLGAMTQFIHPIVDTFPERPLGPSAIFTELHSMNADGTHQTRLVAMDKAYSFAPVWSPDGTRIAFATGSDNVFGVAVVNSDGTGLRRILKGSGGAEFPGSWSPDGSRLAIAASSGDGNSHIEIVDLSTDQRIVLPGGDGDGRPKFSPDGRKIAFFSGRDSGPQVFVMNSDGSARVQLTGRDGESWAAVWSPDGTRLAFNSNRTGRHEIFVMNADGSDQRQLTHVSEGSNYEPTWSPDGRRIAFSSDREGQTQIYVMNADGSGQQNLSRAPGLQESAPSWSKDGLIVYQSQGNLPPGVVADVREKLGIASVLVQSALLAGIVLLALRRGGLPIGALTIIFGLSTALMSVLSDAYRLIPGALLAGATSDLLVWRLRSLPTRSLAFRIVAFFAPASYFAASLGTLALGRGIGWSVHLWAGSVILAGCVGLVLALVFDESERSLVRRPIASPPS
jgi:dipeptidyl aminopeptidase/acylaminoacyl peptidase